MQAGFLIVGRVLLALYFLVPGLMKFLQWDAQIAYMESHDMVYAPVLLALAGIIQITCSIALIINKHVLVSALTLAALTILINLNLHDFWNVVDAQKGREMQNFIKNLGIFAGLLVLASTEPRPSNGLDKPLL